MGETMSDEETEQIILLPMSLSVVIIAAGSDSDDPHITQIQAEIESIYRWNGQIEQGREWSLVAKSHVRLWSDLATWIDENHPYECPQLIALPLVRVAPSFESWLNDQLLD